MRLNVLVVHALGDFSGARKTSVDHALCFRRYAPEHSYLYHDVRGPVTRALRSIRFHAVIFDTTALCIRYYRPRELFETEKARYRFLADSDAVRVALPQDDYDHSAILDRWLDEYRVDVVYTPLWLHRHRFYPRAQLRAEILPALTGYVNDDDVERAPSFAQPVERRSIDIGYRAKRLPPQFGRFGQLKAELADLVLAATAGGPLTVDVSTRPEDVLLGDDWLSFLGRCRWCPGAESGSSLWDPEGTVADRINAFLGEHQGATFDEVEAACFSGLDRQAVFSAPSPRLFEAALAGCGQMLVEGSYLGLRAGEHYVSLGVSEERLSDALQWAQDRAVARRLADACYETLIAPPTFRYRRHVDEVLGKIQGLVERRHVRGSEPPVFDRLAARHREQLVAAAAARSRRAAARALIGAWRGALGAVTRSGGRTVSS